MFIKDAPLSVLSRVGSTVAKRLQNIGITTIEDLLFYFPFRYEDFSRTATIAGAKIGENANIVATVELIQGKRSPRKRMHITEALLSDASGQMRAVWFNQPYLPRAVKQGDRLSLAGRIESDLIGPVMRSPVYEKVAYGRTLHTQGIVPAYHLTANITQKQLRSLIAQALPAAKDLPEILPEGTISRYKLLPVQDSVKLIHFPGSMADVDKARRRFAFEELLLLQLESLRIKDALKKSRSANLCFFEKETKALVDGLPFRLTDAQRKAAWEIIRDMSGEHPMARMLVGDVGSGKTIVALIAMYNAVMNADRGGHAVSQAALMVPTDVLAKQHFQTLTRLLAPTDITTGLYTRTARLAAKPGQSGRHETGASIHEPHALKKSEMKKMVSQGEIDLLIGTHALIEEDVYFKHLVLAVIDEQHRFGVAQRKALAGKSGSGITPHLLSMTATPIPRTLALALYGELEYSVIDELPRGRKTISTFVVPEEKRAGAYGFIRKEIEVGRQAFVICPLIDISDSYGAKSVKEEYEMLDKSVFPDIRIAMLHGRMKPADKDKVMEDFKADRTKILVSTSVVEVGVDVPNATIMMIEGADRFGLAQLHQFRGRVGRGEHKSYCFLFTDSDSARTLERLNALTRIHDGFRLAKEDLKFRGPGEVFGTAQKGFPELKVADLFDYGLMRTAKEEAEQLISEDRTLQKWPVLVEKLKKQEEKVHLE